MNRLLSILTCGVIKSTDLTDLNRNIVETTHNFDRYVTGETRKDMAAQPDFEKRVGIEQRIDVAEKKCEQLQAQIGVQVQRGLRYRKVIKNPAANVEAKRKASAEATLALQEKMRLERKLQTKQRAVKTARSALNVAVQQRDTVEDRELIKDAAELSKGVKFDENAVEELTTAGVDIIEVSAEAVQHNEEIAAAFDRLGANDKDIDVGFDMNDPRELQAALDALGDEEEEKVAASVSQPGKSQSVNDDDDTEILRFPSVSSEGVVKSATATSPIHIYRGDRKQTAIAETTDGRFSLAGSQSSAASSSDASRQRTALSSTKQRYGQLGFF